jgi:hypothetical protein
MLCACVLLLGHCCLAVLSYAYAPLASEVVSMLLVDSIIIVLPYAQHEWQVVSILLVAAQSNASDHLHHWLQVVQAQPFESSARLRQVFPALFLVCIEPEFFRALHVSCMFA